MRVKVNKDLRVGDVITGRGAIEQLEYIHAPFLGNAVHVEFASPGFGSELFMYGERVDVERDLRVVYPPVYDAQARLGV